MPMCKLLKKVLWKLPRFLPPTPTPTFAFVKIDEYLIHFYCRFLDNKNKQKTFWDFKRRHDIWQNDIQPKNILWNDAHKNIKKAILFLHA